MWQEPAFCTIPYTPYRRSHPEGTCQAIQAYPFEVAERCLLTRLKIGLHFFPVEEQQPPGPKRSRDKSHQRRDRS